MTYTKDFNNAVLSTILKIDNVILVFIEKRFVNMLVKNTTQFEFRKRENIEIVKIYHLNILLIVIIY